MIPYSRPKLRETEDNAYAKLWGDNQKALWYVMVFSGVANYKADYGALCCKISSPCLDKVCQVFWHLSESLRRKLFNNTSDKLELRVFFAKKPQFMLIYKHSN